MPSLFELFAIFFLIPWNLELLPLVEWFYNTKLTHTCNDLIPAEVGILTWWLFMRCLVFCGGLFFGVRHCPYSSRCSWSPCEWCDWAGGAAYDLDGATISVGWCTVSCGLESLRIWKFPRLRDTMISITCWLHIVDTSNLLQHIRKCNICLIKIGDTFPKTAFIALIMYWDPRLWRWFNNVMNAICSNENTNTYNY